MNANNLLQILLFIVVLLAAAVPVARYLSGVMDGSSRVVRVFGPLERVLYRIAGVDAGTEMNWKQYAIATIAFNALGVLFLYGLLRLQGLLPGNPQQFGAMTPDGAFNTAVSFVTNTNWQDYTPEQTVGYLTQMLGLTVQNFLSAATGIVVVIALIRGFARHTAQTIGNFWVDLTRVTLYVLVPMAALVAALLMSQGVIQNMKAYQDVPVLQASTYAAPKLDAQGSPVKDDKGNPVTVPTPLVKQTLAMGPVASQEAIKMLGTNGGGFFNANSAHPYENPTPFANFLQIFSILIIPAALCLVFGRMIGDRRQGIAVLAAMTVAFAVAVGVEVSAEQGGNPTFAALHVDQAAGALQSGGNMEGKETRFGIAQTGIFTVATTAASCGAVDTMHDSLTPLGGLVPMLLMQLGEVVFGGVGSGLYGMLVFALLAVFVAGLMIGRTPEYVGKKIESYEMKMVSIVVLLTPLLVLVGTSIAVLADAGKAGIANPGPHGFSEILYAFSSAANNNGSAFAGLTVGTPFYNWMTAIAMWFGRFGTIVPVLAIAGSLAAKKRIAVTSGTLPTHGPLFVVLLLGTVLLVGALTYVPALALGPGVEHLMMWLGA
ncbi:K+-transporting ATPase, A subunit [Burkholderia ambifaria AMMD]|uniref:Potassium-transporting ATPase potassium-binding subunit n=1 Tax=Burkholderia ambifaria (strain ATCC BAA-244 / DSM 16087 / CCUG 44356 / LMG 19182 / AMMD) TaxID=339670 RepID=Q0BD91_BURCM|nr:potassium-transporting ATPase subunit KdpA [Burkholderia ambifaria]ABI87882.1 potassium-transporting ATPase, A subunit [Burkholderia ambifaria AMMD]AJY21946.1 K+-transporting ATPase, A subunit [Burkholderia ambifaria AMMD]MBR7934471.1 potassium-transporting ATPase subunit KdpA [Burkholderia ambifaria]PEH64943.1 potassium-transporting ATPase subunit KdpA [Burkholderia ambifaria]QQC04923.1 potassium-transporting ATPase subunit KdpA [Burkholderia ambifaria]